MNVKNIITIGGGTGTFVVLSGLKTIPDISIAAIVSVADDGGSTGRLRDAYGFLPTGDARQALVALAEEQEEENILRDLFTYRFPKGDIAGHNLGNLLLTALTDRLGSDGKAIHAASEILRVRGRVVPVSEYPATLVAHLESGEALVGQHAINARLPGGAPIVSLSTEKDISVSTEAAETIAKADLIVLGPGDLYSSTLANFAVRGMTEAVSKSKATIAYFVNLFTSAAETNGYTAAKHVAEITRYAGRKPDIIFVHTGELPRNVRDYYAKKNGFPVVDDLPAAAGEAGLGDDPAVVRGDFADPVIIPKTETDAIDRSLIRHDRAAVRAVLQKLL